MKVIRWAAYAFVGCLVLLVAGTATLYAAGYRFNTTRSVPKGFYRVIQEPVSRGVYVSICPPDTAVIRMGQERGYIGAGYCPGGYQKLMKFVAGIGGDRYRFTNEGLEINGQLLANTKPIAADGGGREMPVLRTHGVLAENELILIGDTIPNSFDARYFGVVEQGEHTQVIRPVWLME